MTPVTATTDPGDTDIDVDVDGGANPRCHWDESVCAETPEQFVVFAVASDDVSDDIPEADAEPYCPRHYVLTLARLLELHLPGCSASASEHVLRYGRL